MPIHTQPKASSRLEPVTIQSRRTTKALKPSIQPRTCRLKVQSNMSSGSKSRESWERTFKLAHFVVFNSLRHSLKSSGIIAEIVSPGPVTGRFFLVAPSILSTGTVYPAQSKFQLVSSLDTNIQLSSTFAALSGKFQKSSTPTLLRNNTN